MSDTPQQKQVKIHISPEKQVGQYANLVSITIADNEMVLDFAQMMPNAEQAELVSRVVMTPQVGKNFMSAFQNAILDFDIARQNTKDGGKKAA